MEDDPVAIDLNVDGALLLRELVGIDTYPLVLAVWPNILRRDDRDRVYAVVTEELTEVGILEDGRVHPVVEHWVRCLARPDIELAARIATAGPDGGLPSEVLRMSLVRNGDTHVLAVRSDDHVVIQSVFHEGRGLETLAAALAAALGSAPALTFEPLTVSTGQMHEFPEEQEERRRALMELGAHPRSALVLSRAFDEIHRRAEILMIEHQDGTDPQPDLCFSVFDTESGRFAVTPRIALDGETRVTYSPGDDAALRTGVEALVELLPGRSWFDTSRIR
ncbi:ESX secretion-associated protein EspG [Nocardia panacis]|uniref:ESX secretion-associated protein EspG n=1 Tax=Nocardia panacis TaxID=2340916 RepID=A0A3A4KG03_9NOCA|nr:ESX secretion-associated protein EspG [Nocardia panacis]RJO79839.1 ESX secretion-associated protein EspG [Nocardia panacis]